MKAATPSEFLDFLDEEFAWRRKELTLLRGLAQSATGLEKNAHLRAGLAMLYAHWEGFVRASSEGFLEYVGRRRLKHTELCSGLLSLALRAKLAELAASSRSDSHIEFVDFVRRGMTGRARLPRTAAPKVGSNLNAQRLKDIVLVLGLDYSAFELKEQLLDEKLLRWRNEIAHGRLLCPHADEFDLLYAETTALMRHFKTQLEYSVRLQTYRG